MQSPIYFTIESIMQAFADETVVEVRVVDSANKEHICTIAR